MSQGFKPTDALVGQILLGEYAILDVLGQGGFARVYKAKQLSADRFVALKTITSNEPDVVARFTHEVKVHSKLHHKNVAQALDCLTVPETGQTFFVMEYLPGLTMQEVLRTQGKVLRESDVINVFSQICDALEHAHNKGIVHRDLKPGNIILCEEDGRLLVKVVDFGIARVQEEMQRLTKTGETVGSPLYMSPEQCMGKELDQRADVYSLGIVLFEALTGQRPYPSLNLREVMRDHCDPAVHPPGIESTGCTMRGAKQLDTIIDTALATFTDKRFQSIGDFKEALRFWYKSVESGDTDRAVPIRMSAEGPRQAVKDERPISSSDERQLRELVLKKQESREPGKAQWDSAQFYTSVEGKETGARVTISGAQLNLSESLVGKILAKRYRILDLLGEGAMAVVYRALDTSNQQMVAIKTLKFVDSDLCARFAREVEIHSELKHANIVKAIDCFEVSNGQSFFVMEYLKGVALENYIATQGKVNDLMDLSSIIAQICDAIEYAHEKGVIHRDIKPENIILIEQRGQLRVKVLDFGVAKIQEDLQRLTRTGVIIGSPAYMSPEQCLGKPLDCTSDIYSLAVVAYELVTGKLPYAAANDIEVMKAHCNQAILPVPITTHRQDLAASDLLESVFQKALKKDPSQRYEDVAELKQDLDQWWRKTTGAGIEAVSPFRSTTTRRRRAAKSTRASAKATLEKPEQVQKRTEQLQELMDGHRSAQAQSYIMRFEKKRDAFDYKRVMKPILACLVIFAIVGGIVFCVSWLGTKLDISIKLKDEKDANGAAGRTARGTNSQLGTTSPTATNSQMGTTSPAGTFASTGGTSSSSTNFGTGSLNSTSSTTGSTSIPGSNAQPSQTDGHRRGMVINSRRPFR